MKYRHYIYGARGRSRTGITRGTARQSQFSTPDRAPARLRPSQADGMTKTSCFDRDQKSNAGIAIASPLLLHGLQS
ncbi:MAG: hypothetical protein QF668_05945 [Arenicellales bacterium]|nr:hypothetical protein [Arenicellales bacterium]